jgi:hypothetical protein
MTAYIVEYDNPSLPKGATVQVDGIGLLTNGEETYVSPEQAEDFRIRHYEHKTVVQAFKGDAHITAKTTKADKDADPVVTDTEPLYPVQQFDPDDSLTIPTTSDEGGN